MAGVGDAPPERRPYGHCMIDAHPTPTGSPLWSRIFASMYEPSLWPGEVAGMRRRRRELLGAATGRTLEIGAGTGLNLAGYPADLPALIVTEPDPAMRRQLERRAEGFETDVHVIDAPAERLPFDDGSLDTVVSTLVLCTVDDPQAALSEIVRVLRPGGRLLFIEHVRSDSRMLAWWQDRLAGPWRRFAKAAAATGRRRR
jgi:ubiquinone/menaquinone biosynthesis C-methylase UbiE